LALAALAFLPGAAGSAGAVTTERVSVSSAGVEGDGQSDAAAISADGRYVAFQSVATNLHPDDADGTFDIFVRDRQAGATTLVSRATGATGAKGNGDSFSPAISADGRFVAFFSRASNLHPDDADTTDDVFVRDLQTNATTLVSRAAGVSGAKGNSASTTPAISSDGLYVAFTSSATNLHPDDPDVVPDVFVRDLQANTVTLVSRATGVSGAKGNSNSTGPAISADGRYVAFTSLGNNLHADDADSTQDVFARDLQTSTTTLVSRATGASGAKGNGTSGGPDISGDGRFVAFGSNASNLHADDPDPNPDAFVRDLQASTTTLVNRASGASGAKGNQFGTSPHISPDGRFVAFGSVATNLHPDDADLFSDIFVRDLQTSTTVLASRSAAGVKGNDNSVAPDISAGALVAFASSANNLVPNDDNTVRDVFVTNDFDVDGMPNDYELAQPCLNPVVNDSGGDPDFDELASGAEFGLGTDSCDSDTDGDSLPDGSDSCPVLAEDFDGFEDTNGCPDPDNDLDSVCDSGQTSISCTGSDNGKQCFDPAGALSCPTLDCRSIAEDIDAFKDADGCPEPDNDNDGMPDGTDECPGTDSLAGADGMLGSPQDVNHNGVSDGAEGPLTTDDSPGAFAFEDYDLVLDGDGCHDSPGEDFDGDGYADDDEALKIGTNAGYPCGYDGWPSNVWDASPSDNKLDVQDIISFIAPVRRLDTSPNQNPPSNYLPRWDLAPGANFPFPNHISIFDITTMLNGVPGSPAYPPMFDGPRAFGKECPLA
jgi:Tol biopolymer transport system component